VTTLVINPNRVTANTELVQHWVNRWFGDNQVLVVNPDWGPEELAGEWETQLSATAVLDKVATLDIDQLGIDGIVMAGFAEPGVEALREVVPVPVVDITESGPMAAMLTGRRYGIITSSHAAIPIVDDRLVALGLHPRCNTVVAAGLGVPEMMADRRATAERVISVGQELLHRHHCASIVLGCGGFTGLAAEISGQLGVPVIEPVRAAVELVRGLTGIGAAAPATTPTPRHIENWPLSHKPIPA
jgi:allantoin racemase